MKVVFRISWSRVAEQTMRVLLEQGGATAPAGARLVRLAGPFYGNEIATLLLDGRSATLVIEKAGRDRDGTARLTPVVDLPLA